MKGFEKRIKLELRQLAEHPYSTTHTQKYEINGHVIDFSFSQKMMYAVTVDNAYYQVHPTMMGNKCVRDIYKEWLTETQFILKKLELPYDWCEQ